MTGAAEVATLPAIGEQVLVRFGEDELPGVVVKAFPKFGLVHVHTEAWGPMACGPKEIRRVQETLLWD